MVHLLGPVPRALVQRGKFYSSLDMFTFSGLQPDATNSLRSLLETGKIPRRVDYAFASFLAQILRYDPGERLSPRKAACHPFLAREMGLAYLIRASTQNGSSDDLCGYPSVLVSKEAYSYKPHIDTGILRRHPSSLDLLYMGTSLPDCGDKGCEKRRVAQVPPLVFQACQSNTAGSEEAGSGEASLRIPSGPAGLRLCEASPRIPSGPAGSRLCEASPRIPNGPAGSRLCEANPRIQDGQAGSGSSEASPRIQDGPAGTGLCEASPRIQDGPAGTGLCEGSPMIQDGPAGTGLCEASPRIQDGLGDSGPGEASPRIQDGLGDSGPGEASPEVKDRVCGKDRQCPVKAEGCKAQAKTTRNAQGQKKKMTCRRVIVKISSSGEGQVSVRCAHEPGQPCSSTPKEEGKSAVGTGTARQPAQRPRAERPGNTGRKRLACNQPGAPSSPVTSLPRLVSSSSPRSQTVQALVKGSCSDLASRCSDEGLASHKSSLTCKPKARTLSGKKRKHSEKFNGIAGKLVTSSPYQSTPKQCVQTHGPRVRTSSSNGLIKTCPDKPQRTTCEPQGVKLSHDTVGTESVCCAITSKAERPGQAGDGSDLTRIAVHKPDGGAQFRGCQRDRALSRRLSRSSEKSSASLQVRVSRQTETPGLKVVQRSTVRGADGKGQIQRAVKEETAPSSPSSDGCDDEEVLLVKY